MRIRKTEHRGARGLSKNGLKVGQAKIRKMTDVEFQGLIGKLRSESNKHRAIHASKRRYKELRRVLAIIRGNKGKVFLTYHDDYLLNELLPDRKNNWLSFDKRKKIVSVDLDKLSFLDNPQNTLLNLKKIVDAEASAKSVFINFRDHYCFDISPYMLLGLMRQQMANVFRGGGIQHPVADALKACDLDKLLNMATRARSWSAHVMPFKLHSRRPTGASTHDNLPAFLTSEEKTAQDFVETLKEWLKDLENPSQLSQVAQNDVYAILCELLDNAKRHGDPVTRDAQWHISGLMQQMINDSKQLVHLCNVAIVNYGSTIFETLSSCDGEVKQQVLEYVGRHKAVCPEECLWNVAALQDGVSRMPANDITSHGNGLMSTLVSFFNLWFGSENPFFKPALTIISGKSCIMVKYPYNETSGEIGRRKLAFNKANDLDIPPDGSHVFSLPLSFPGTLITLRFVLNPERLEQVI